jgi:signal transduction histidine kinase
MELRLGFPTRSVIAMLFACVAIFASRADVSTQQQDANLDHVVLQLKWLHQFQFAGYYAAISQGYYQNAGLKVELREAVPDRDPTDDVLSGRADFGVGTSELVLSRSQGKPVVVLATIYQHSPLILLARKQPGVDDLQSLRDRPMMIEPLSAELFAYFRDEGIDPKSLHLVPHTFDVHDLIDGHVDAMSAYSTDEPFQLIQAHVDFLTFSPRAGGIDFYGDNLFTTEQEIRHHPDRVRAFREASLRGWEYAMAHQAEIVDLILSKYSRRKSREHLLFEAQKTADLVHPELIELGHMNPGRWSRIAETYSDFGMVPKNFSLDGFLYDPNPRANLAWVYWTMAILGFVAVGATGWAMPLIWLNRKLVHEVAERRKAEEELRRAKEAAEADSQAKGRYMAVMTHEVRTPLNGIIGLSQLLLNEPLASEQREQVELIELAAHSLFKISSDVLDYEKIEAGRIQLETTQVPIRKFVRDLCEFFRVTAASKRLQLTYAVESDVPEHVATDPTRLRQILANLLSNAVKFTPEEGRVNLRVAIASQKTTSGGSVLQLAFEVADSGVGISAEQLTRLFKPYAQADASVHRRAGGTGLGLLIALRLAELLGGDLTVRSALGEGSTFTAKIGVRV